MGQTGFWIISIMKVSIVVLLTLAACWSQAECNHLKDKLQAFAHKIGIAGPQPRDPDYFVKKYDLINEYLTSQLPDNEDAVANLNLAERWLSELNSDSRHSEKLAKALEQFVQLKKLQGDRLCIGSSANIFNSNYDATSGSIRRLKEEGASSARRIEKVIWDFARRHAAECPAKYKEKYQLLAERMPKKLRDHIEMFMGQIIAQHIVNEDFEARDFNKSEPLSYIERHPIETVSFVYEKMAPIKSHADAILLYKTLDKFASDSFEARCLHETDRNNDVDEPKVRELFQKYLVNECQDYINWLEGVFEPVKFDSKLVDISEIFSLDNELDSQFLHSLTYYSSCERFINDKDKALRDFLRYIKWRFKVMLV